MEEIQYKKFSLRTHKKNWKVGQPNVCQFELTFGCGLHCKHCYTDCYNKQDYLKKELNTSEVKLLLDKAQKIGVVWVCFTGGDPLAREDFLEIYSYAKEKGFIVTIFTNGYSMTQEIAGHLKQRRPFAIEITLNAASEDLYEEITQVKGSFKKAIDGISLMRKANLPVKIKTMITNDNFEHLTKIRQFVKKMGLEFYPAFDIYARLNGDNAPCNLRVSPSRLLGLDKKLNISHKDEFACDKKIQDRGQKIGQARLFNCAIGGGDGIYIDPYGNTFPCQFIRKPSFNLLDLDIGSTRNKLFSLVRNKNFSIDSICNGCNLRDKCSWCPGKAFVETGNMEDAIAHYCDLAHRNVQLIEQSA